jgi:tRNA pseudouridine55 synthase
VADFLERSRVDGWVVLDKPSGLTSTAAVARVRKLFVAKKAGHGGTLDPLATGVLPIALGEATKTVEWVMGRPKTYEFAVRWGAETSTDDLEGPVTATSAERPSAQMIRSVLPQFLGPIEQTPPAYSAVKIGGKRAYALARRGEGVELGSRIVEVHSFDLMEARPDEALFTLRCGKGTYVRSLARDLGRKLGCLGHVVALRRTSAGPFTADKMISLAKLEQFSHNGAGRKAILTALLPLRTALDDIPALALGEVEAKRLRQGQPLRMAPEEFPSEHQPILVLHGENPVALAILKDGILRPKRIFNL